jgi:hypothetical protein
VKVEEQIKEQFADLPAAATDMLACIEIQFDDNQENKQEN